MSGNGPLQGEIISAAQGLAVVTVGEHIREHRLRSRLTPQALADQLGIEAERLNQIEQGRDRLDVSELTLLADLFGVPLASFFETRSPVLDGSDAEAPKGHDGETHATFEPAAKAADTALAVEIVSRFTRIRDQGLRRALLDFLGSGGGENGSA